MEREARMVSTLRNGCETSMTLYDAWALRKAFASDIDSVMRIERTAGYEGLVGTWTFDRHLEEFALSSSQYLVADEGGRITGFALLQGLGDADQRTHLKRTAVAEAGKGHGSRLLSSVLEWVFTQSATNRLDLDVFVENVRATRAYERAGFRIDGVLRDFHRLPDGGFRSMWLMTVLRREWEARVAGAERSL